MKTVTQYKDELTGKLFNSIKEAVSSENKERGIRKMFSWLKDGQKYTAKKSEKDTCQFANGGWCVQRDKQFYDRLINSIIEAVYLYEPWIQKEYKRHGGLKPEFVGGATLLGRYLDDGNSSLNKYNNLQMRICKKCYREYGQPYYALHCKCNGTSGETGQHTIETRFIDGKH